MRHETNRHTAIHHFAAHRATSLPYQTLREHACIRRLKRSAGGAYRLRMYPRRGRASTESRFASIKKLHPRMRSSSLLKLYTTCRPGMEKIGSTDHSWALLLRSC